MTERLLHLAGLASDKALIEPELVEAIGAGLSTDALAFLRRELWRARFAMIAYSNIRRSALISSRVPFP